MPSLVLLPGMDGTGDLFAPLLTALPPSLPAKVVRYPTAEPLGYAQLDGVAKAALPPADDFVILGESFSGPLAISLAAEPPSNLKALVLCCSFARNPRPVFSSLGPLVAALPMQ